MSGVKGLSSKRYRFRLVVLQVALRSVASFRREIRIQRDLAVDNVSVLMAMIVGVVGGFIAVYALGT
jgi:NADH:ubiquinone oxidoreductase subunit 5 (subunit L)/multisubunit Na+/H+ antiporter MnhA subunit